MDLGASTSESLWIINTYPLVMTGLLLGTGTLGDRYGHKRVFQYGIALFGVASLVAAFSPSPGVLTSQHFQTAEGYSPPHSGLLMGCIAVGATVTCQSPSSEAPTLLWPSLPSEPNQATEPFC